MPDPSEAPKDLPGDLPGDLPVPVDDGACDHLAGIALASVDLISTAGRALASVDLISTAGRAVNPARIPGWVVIYCYPMTGRPDRALPAGWDRIAGARGCTPQACAFRDHYRELQALGAQVLGLSAQTTEYQREAAERLHLPFELLSDAELTFSRALRLPTFEAEGMRLIKRVTLIAQDGTVRKHFYPVFPPERNADDVIAWLKAHAIAS